MDYIVLDMEWNQAWPGSPAARRAQIAQLRGEIIQIGAVRITESRQVADEFQVMVRNSFFHHLNKQISKLTGIRETQLQAEGIPFPEAIRRFRTWMGDAVCLLTWGFDDIPILQENLRLYGLDESWTANWCNAQVIFNAQTDHSGGQKSLKTAMEIFGIAPTRPAHDALGDAYHTALICARLDLARGTSEYGAALDSFHSGATGAELPGFLGRTASYGYPSKRAALEALAGAENRCPECGSQMQSTRWFSQTRQRYMDMAVCPEHGKYLVRVRISPQPDGNYWVSRTVYEGTPELLATYTRRLEKAEAATQPAASHTHRRRHRHPRRKKADGSTSL